MSTATACPECRHVFPNGKRCHAAALRGKPLCYFHARTRNIVHQNRNRYQSVALPPLEDRGAIQIAIDEVIAAHAAGKLDRRAVWPYLAAIQMASQNLARAKDNLACPDPVAEFEESAGESLVPGDPAATESSADNCIVQIHAAATHESDPEPPPPPDPPAPQPKPSRWGLFSSRTEMNLFYKAEDAWLAGFFSRQAGKQSATVPEEYCDKSRPADSAPPSTAPGPEWSLDPRLRPPGRVPASSPSPEQPVVKAEP